jgi:PAS domain S-box-containing protein
MSQPDGNTEQVESLLATPNLAGALESDQFRRFLDQVPIAIIVSDMKGTERVVYANPEFEKLSGQASEALFNQPWSTLQGQEQGRDPPRELGPAIKDSNDFVGTFRIERAAGDPTYADAYSNVIEDDEGVPAYRLAVLVDVGAHGPQDREELEEKLREKDARLMEIQHRVKNNLQMITALMRIEARNASGKMDTAPFDRLAGRIEAVQILYSLLADQDRKADQIDLGVYLSDIASSVLRAHAVEGIRLETKVDSYPVSVNVALPTGLVVNELLTNALKHAFAGRDGGTITLSSLSEDGGCRITIADDGIGLPEGTEWPARGKLSAMIVQSLRQNARARLDVVSTPGRGVRVAIEFERAAAKAG